MFLLILMIIPRFQPKNLSSLAYFLSNNLFLVPNKSFLRQVCPNGDHGCNFDDNLQARVLPPVIEIMAAWLDK
jgi:hypothetical protein